MTKTCLSQWYPSPFSETNGIRYATAEHYMMERKAVMFNAFDLAEEILKDDDPARAKALGRQVPNFDPDIWDARKYYLVIAGNRLKFFQNEPLKTYLLSTGKRILAEASPKDLVWGTGLTEDHPDAKNPARWRGSNLLGFALMRVRSELFMRRQRGG
ncbi:NADAR family protein [Temperatibacter marinus]